MPSPVLTTLEKLKVHLGISGSGEDTLLTQLLLGIEETIGNATGRARVAGRNPFESVEATEYCDGTGREILLLKRRPVTAIAGVFVDQDGYYGLRNGGFSSSVTEWEIGVDYVPKCLEASEQNASILLALKSGDFETPRGVWPIGRGNVKVTYTAGYGSLDSSDDPTGVPADIELAVHQLAAAVRKGAEKGGPLAGETFGRYSYQLLMGGSMSDSSLASVRGIIARYAEVNI